MMLPTPCFTFITVLVRWWAVLGFLQTWHLELRPNDSSLVSSDQRILFRCLGAFFLTPSGRGRMPFTEERLSPGYYAMKPQSSAAVTVVLLEVWDLIQSCVSKCHKSIPSFSDLLRHCIIPLYPLPVIEKDISTQLPYKYFKPFF